jgi:hypothetical protein
MGLRVLASPATRLVIATSDLECQLKTFIALQAVLGLTAAPAPVPMDQPTLLETTTIVVDHLLVKEERAEAVQAVQEATIGIKR